MRSVRAALFAALLLVAATAPAAHATTVSLTATCTVFGESRAYVSGNVGDGVSGHFRLEVPDGPGLDLRFVVYEFVGNSFEMFSVPGEVVQPFTPLLLVLRDADTGALLDSTAIDCADATPATITATCTILESGRALIAGTVAELYPELGNIGVFDFSIPVDPFDPQSSNEVGFLYPVDNGDFELTTFEWYQPVAGTTVDIGLGRGGDFHGVASTRAVCVALIRSVTDLTNDLVGSGALSQGQANSLLVKIDNSTASATKGNIDAAVRQLEAFKNEINALYTAGKISQAQRDSIVAAADRQIAALRAGA
jgi:FIMAH domain-containing protein